MTPSDEAIARVRERYQLNHPLVLYVGNIKPHKNLVRLIEAFAELRRRGFDELKLLIIGDEISKLPALRRAVHSHKLHKHVRFLGYLADETLAILYRLASVFVFPSLYEGFGLPPLEAMASGTPVVTSNVSSMPEVTGDAAVLVDPYNVESIVDGIARVLTDPALAAELRRKGIARAREFSWERSVERTRAAVPGSMRTALIHDWLTGMRGGERVLEALCGLYPEADIFTLYHRRGSVSAGIERHRIRTSFVQRLPMASTYYRQYLPLFPMAIEQFDLDAYDLVISSSHCAAKAVVAPGRARHLCYCHSPMRYAWDQFEAYFGAARTGPMVSRWIYRPVLARLARWDAATAARVHRFMANSEHVAGRIRRYYNRVATVVYPPVDTAFFHPAGDSPGSHFLIVSALVPYKRIELAMAACERVGASLRIVGDGPDRKRLEAQAGPHVSFLGRLADEEVRDEYRRALAVLLPGEEDFGIVPVEAQACGRPVVALGRGGALETVIDGENGVLFAEPEVAALAAALDRVARMRFDAAAIARSAARFSRERHLERMRAVIDETIAAPAGTRW